MLIIINAIIINAYANILAKEVHMPWCLIFNIKNKGILI